MDISHTEPMERLLAFKTKKTPQVRQTLTSKYRMLKANPLLMCELGKKATNSDNKEESFFKPLKTLVSVLDASIKVQSKPVTNKTQKNTVANTKTQRPNTASKPEWNKPLLREKPTLEARKKLFNKYTIVKNKQKNTQQLQKLVSTATASLTSAQDNGVPLDINRCNIPSISERRSTIIVKTPSISRKLVIEPNPCVENTETASHNTQIIQECSISTTEETAINNNQVTTISEKTSNNQPKKNENVQDLTCQKSSLTPMQGTKSTKIESKTLTPSNSARKISLFATPHRRVKPTTPISNSDSKQVAKKLREWLQQRGKKVGDYHHLKCFGVCTENITNIESAQEEEKENIIEVKDNDNDQDVHTYLKPVSEGFNLESVAEEALMDLHKLILDGYPPEQCEIWLKLIKQKHTPVEEKPQYWECRAALEQTKGNINLAVECYKNAIIQGAEVENVDKCLDQLLQKFSLLDINSETNANERSKVVKDMRNVFKSSIIQFAVQERIFKKKSNDGFTIEKKMIATPVRRSTRMSRSGFTSTPGIHIFSSLQEMDRSMRDNMNFHCNKALKD